MVALTLASLAAATPSLQSGSFQLDEPWEDVLTRQASAVDTALDDVPRLLRPLIRPILLRSVWSCDGWTTEVNATELSVQCRGRDPLRMPADGTRTPVVLPGGREFTVSGDSSNTVLSVRAEGRNGSQLSTWSFLHSEGLLVTRTIQSRWLPTDVTWTVMYRRVEQLPVAPSP
jgi:hypothetical protein